MVLGQMYNIVVITMNELHMIIVFMSELHMILLS